MKFKVILMEEDIKNHDELGSSTLSFPQLFCLGEGLKKAPHYIFDKNGLSSAKIWLTITFEATEKPVVPKKTEEVKQAVTKQDPAKP